MFKNMFIDMSRNIIEYENAPKNFDGQIIETAEDFIFDLRVKCKKELKNNNANKSEIFDYILKYFSVDKENPRKEWREISQYQEAKLQEVKSKCICSQKIELLFFILNSENGNILRTGCECIDKINDSIKKDIKIAKKQRENKNKDEKRQCAVCFNYKIPAKSSINITVCNLCLKTHKNMERDSIKILFEGKDCINCGKRNLKEKDPRDMCHQCHKLYFFEIECHNEKCKKIFETDDESVLLCTECTQNKKEIDCERCKLTVFIDKIKEKNICDNCYDKVDIKCIHCHTMFCVHISEKNRTLCPSCSIDIKKNCRCCKKQFVIKKIYDKDNNVVLCSKCSQNKKEIICERCKLSAFIDIIKEKNICDDCYDKVDIKCIHCHIMFCVHISEKNRTLCPSCSIDIKKYCKGCNIQFLIKKIHDKNDNVILCSKCTQDKKGIICERCNYTVYVDNDENGSICDDCYDKIERECNNCHKIFYVDVDEDYKNLCRSCSKNIKKVCKNCKHQFVVKKIHDENDICFKCSTKKCESCENDFNIERIENIATKFCNDCIKNKTVKHCSFCTEKFYESERFHWNDKCKRCKEIFARIKDS